MNKKSQFYIFAAVIFISAVFLIVMNSSSVTVTRLEGITDLRDNYIYEAKIVIDNSVYNNQDISDSLANYTEEYLNYADSRELNLGIVYLYQYNGRIYIVNYINEPINIPTIDVTLQLEEEVATDYIEEIAVSYQNETYYYNFNRGPQIQFKTLFVKNE